MKNIYCIITLLGVVTWTACRPKEPVPKPKGYYKIDLPSKTYRIFDSSAFPFTFEYPSYGIISRDNNQPKGEYNPYWINIYFPEMDATIYLSYKQITRQEPLEKLIDDSYRLSYAHNVKADYIKTPEFTTDNGLTGIFYFVSGNAASAYQFYVSDNRKNFLRASLYFNISPNADSLKPAAEFLKKDMEHLVHTLKFR